MKGLDEQEWKRVVTGLENIAEFYDAMNSIGTFFQADRWRREAARRSGKGLDVLEVGCGPGTFARELAGRRILCVDPSEELLRVAAKKAPTGTEFRKGEAESLPVEDSSFDRVFCSFSFRDFRDRPAALKEMHRVLRKGGLLVILDIARHENAPAEILMKLQLKHVVPTIARAIIPRERFEAWKDNPYDELWETFRKFQTPAEIARMAEEASFVEVEHRLLSLGGAFLLTAKK